MTLRSAIVDLAIQADDIIADCGLEPDNWAKVAADPSLTLDHAEDLVEGIKGRMYQLTFAMPVWTVIVTEGSREFFVNVRAPKRELASSYAAYSLNNHGISYDKITVPTLH